MAPILIILAGGHGERLAPFTDDCHKGLIALGGKCILEQLIADFAQAGGEEAALVVGWQSELVRARLGSKYAGVNLYYVENRRYHETKTAHGLYLAQNFWLGRDFISLDGDLIMDPYIMRRLTQADKPNLMFVAPGLPADPATEMMVVARGDCVEEIVYGSRGLNDARLQGKRIAGYALPVVKVGGRATKDMALLLEQSKLADEYIDAFSGLCQRHPMSYEMVPPGMPWCEVDTPADLKRAVDIIIALHKKGG